MFLNNPFKKGNIVLIKSMLKFYSPDTQYIINLISN